MSTYSQQVPPTALRRCPSDEHRHDAAAGAASPRGRLPRRAARRRPETETAFAELDRRRCAGGPLVEREDGVLDRLEPDGWIGAALSALPERPDVDQSLGAVLEAMDIRTVEDLRSFRRLVAVHAALAALRWSAAPRGGGPAALEALLAEIDDPSASWR